MRLKIVFVLIQLSSFTIYQIISQTALRSFKPGGQYICLTFDDGPDGELTPKLLDLLLFKKVKATFFIFGSKCEEYPQIVSRMVREGHEVASHGWSHENNFLNSSLAVIHEDLRRTANVIQKTVGVLPQFIRPPDGNTTPTINKEIKEVHNISQVVLWSLNSNDIQIPYPSKKVKNIVNRAKPGDIVLLHDMIPKTLELLPSIMDGLIDRGFECVTISQMSSFPDDSPHRSRH